MLGYKSFRGSRVAGAALAFGLMLGLGGCSNIFDVSLPAQLTSDALDDPVGATTQINSIIVMFENSMSDFKYIIHGHEDGGEIAFASPSISNSLFAYSATAPDFSATNTTGQPGGFLQARLFAKSLHEKLDKSWTVAQVPKRLQYLAISSLYEGAVYAWMGSTLCEGTLDGGKVLSQADMYALADQTLTRAITEIGAAGGDFAMPFNITGSALTMAYGFRAQNRWMSGDMAGATADAVKIPNKYYAYLTREATSVRRNLPYYNGPEAKFGILQRTITWWQGGNRQPNPATGQKYADPVPFTGYTNLGILPDGRAIRDDGLPIRVKPPAGWAVGTDVNRNAAIEDAAVADVRVPFQLLLAGSFSGLQEVSTKWPSCAATVCGNFAGGTGESAYVPLVNWKEMVLIRAEAAGGQAAIDLVNTIRASDGMPAVTYLAPGDANGIRWMILEERRRALLQEGRFYYSKLKNLDLAWFPRLQGNMPTSQGAYQGGVRLTMPDTEYQLNTNIGDLNMRGAGCDAASRPSF